MRPVHLNIYPDYEKKDLHCVLDQWKNCLHPDCEDSDSLLHNILDKSDFLTNHNN